MNRRKGGEDLIKIGLMGCGVVARYGHIPAIAASPHFELTAMYEPDASRTNVLQSEHNVPVFTDTDDFFHAGFDAVIITSPAPCHYTNVLEAARYGKHVLCEKPLATDEREAAEMIAVMERSGLLLFTAFDYRFSPAAQTIKSIVQDGRVGDVRSLRLSYIWNMHGKFADPDPASPDQPRQLNMRRAGRMLEGGPMVDCGVHQIDLARWWLDSEVTSCRAEGAWVDEYEAPDHMYLHMRHANEAHTLVEISYSYGFTAKEPVSHFTYRLIGTEGIVYYDREAKIFEMRNSTGTTRFPFAKEKNFSGMYEAFAGAIRSGLPGDVPTGSDGLIATRIARTATEELIGRRFGPLQPATNEGGWL
ncbi:Inositol 2-dehydrogenase/D-chiro-inositol 3-dehydrogenase [Paenibacillus solanacearum]|uniref:Inositol 2-dehydrogenase/D-chiro-inositol 3-dehydrogenase n=1 Tax=Paenibacillus solanacearum TaxID=2048548 RepID=A0A916K0X9_9BACL|nr:Gfo/Idh/MocA family oxidoreductase [Paenibacillus solanacearum]CAG7623622.1 Inositol 2-dehydrogenase/D-chiro-inositol 3-dehydrogenase [Paenibacillus solanacearum]